MNKTNVLFIGSFKPTSKTGHVGGQMFACNSLVNSELKNKINFHLLDTTAKTNLHRSLINRMYNSILRIFRFSHIILTKKVDIVMAFSSYGLGFIEKGIMLVISKLFNKKTIIAPRSGFLIDNIESSRFFRIVSQYILTRCDTIICQGTYWKKYFNQNFILPTTDLTIIHNWIDYNEYDFKSLSNNDIINVLFMGWIEENKGVFDLIPVIDKFKESNIVWNIAGKGKDYLMFKNLIKEKKIQKKVNLLGWVTGKDKFELLKNSQVLIIPSYKEGLPNVLLEAMASGCGIIASDVGAISDLIIDGYNGFLIEPGNVDMIISKLNEYVSDRSLISTHAKHALDTLISKNSIDNVIPKFDKLLRI